MAARGPHHRCVDRTQACAHLKTCQQHTSWGPLSATSTHIIPPPSPQQALRIAAAPAGPPSPPCIAHSSAPWMVQPCSVSALIPLHNISFTTTDMGWKPLMARLCPHHSGCGGGHNCQGGPPCCVSWQAWQPPNRQQADPPNSPARHVLSTPQPKTGTSVLPLWPPLPPCVAHSNEPSMVSV